MIVAPASFAPPHPVFVVLPLALFGFKLTKLLFLYRWRVQAGLAESFAAGIAGLALSHVVARAILTGLVHRGIGFYRTPKQARAPGLLQALLEAREELLFLLALALGALALLGREDGDLFDVRLWAVMLAIQAVPYAAAGLMSWISARSNRAPPAAEIPRDPLAQAPG